MIRIVRQRYRIPANGLHTQEWQNPEVVGRNKLPGRFQHPPTIPDTSAQLESPWVMYLDGKWNFKFLINPSLEPEGVDWQSVEVPSNWEVHGYGVPQYLNMDYPLNHDIRNPPAIDPKDNPTGYYRKSFQIPPEWKERLPHVTLRFEGIRSAAWIWINGEEVGYTQNTYSPAEFIVGPYLKMGNNQIDVKVIKNCAGTYLENQDMWRLGGIIRSVSLIAAPDGGIFDVFARCSFDSNFINADLTVTITLDALRFADSEERFVRCYLYEAGGRSIVASCPLTPVRYQTGRSTVVETSIRVVNPRKWSADEPNLYSLVFELSEEDGRVLDVRSLAWGFRQVDIDCTKFGVLKVNGRPVKLYGVNRHDFHPQFGQAVPREIIESDLILMKRNNINAIRCSHYPNQTALYDAADRLGLYVIDEANMESHGLRHVLPASKPIWRKNCVDRVERMVLSHRNHPCVIMWSLGNEAGQGSNLREMKKSALALDTTRPIHYEGDHKLKHSDVFSLMYPSIGALRKVGKGRVFRAVLGERGSPFGCLFWPHKYRRKPFILCEFAHAMGNSLGGFSDYMKEIDRFPNIAGAFIWDFADQALYRFSDEGQRYLAYGGDFGDFPNDGIFCADGIFSADRRAKPMLEEVKTLYAPVSIRMVDIERGVITLRNKHSHKDFSDYQIDWTLERDGIVLGEGSLRKPDLGPGEERGVSLFRSIADYSGGGEAYLNFFVRLLKEKSWAPAKHLVARFQFPIPKPQGNAVASDLIFGHLKLEKPERIAESGVGNQEPEPGRWRHERQDERFLIASSKIGAIIDLNKGALEVLDFGKGNILSGPLQPDFFRAPTDNERFGVGPNLGALVSNKLLRRAAVDRAWESAGRRRRLKNWESKLRSDGLEVALYFRIRGFIGKFAWKLLFKNDGSVLVNMRGLPRREMLRFGSRMIIPARYSRVSWYGLGPQECYIDRKTSAVVGLHEAEVEKLGYDYLKPQENGNRTEVRRVAFSDGGSAIVFTASEHSRIDFSAGFAPREAIALAAHAHEIIRDADIHVNIDEGQRGLGGCRPGVLDLTPKHKIRPLRLRTLTYTISREAPGAAD